MNADHKDALILLARVFSGIESQEAVMISIEHLGFHLRLKPKMACVAHASHSCEK